MDRYEATHAGFQRDLKASEPARQAIGEHLRCSGRFTDVYLPPLVVAERRADAHKCRDHGDIIGTLPDGRRIRYEVKHAKKLEFTGPGDYKYPSVLVVTRYKHDDAMLEDELKPFAYYIVNKALTHYAVVPVSTQPQWKVRVTGDQDGNNQERYFADKRLCTWRSMGITQSNKDWIADYEAEEARQRGGAQ
jgi:hypothetical protein